MSLYSGITFSKAGASSESPIVVEGSSTSSSNAVDASSSSTTHSDVALSSKDAALQDAARYAAAQVEQAAKDAAEKDRKAALGFMPIMRKRPAPGAAANRARGMPTASVSSAATVSASPAPAAAGPPGTVSTTPAASSSAIISAPPAIAMDISASSTPNLLTGRTLIVPPSMTLDEEDVNGFKSSAAGKRANNKGNKNKKKGKNKREDDPALAWTAEYDPARPTDYNEYKIYSKLARAERREIQRREREKERQKRLKEAYGESGSGSNNDDDGDYYSDEDEEDSDTERRRRIANAEKKFATACLNKPKIYDMPPEEMEMFNPEAVQTAADATAKAEVIDVDKVDDAAEGDLEPVKITEAAEDDWAAWSGSATTAKASGSGGVAIDDPYARRVAMSQQHQLPQPQAMPTRPGPPARLPSYSASANPASQSPQPPQTQASPYAMSSFPMPSEMQNFPIPGLGPSIPLLPPSFMPQAASPSPVPAPHHVQSAQLPAANPMASATATASGVTLEEAQAKARAIAARLASLGKLGGGAAAPASAAVAVPTYSPSPSPGGMYPIPGIDEPIPGLGMPSTSSAVPPNTATGSSAGNSASTSNPEEFAKNLMAKYGWSKGQGLGATSQGMLNPLALSSDKSAQGKGGKKKQAEVKTENKPIQKVTGMATAKGRVVSDLKSEKDRAEKEKYGEPSRVVCLSNMVGREEVDNELVHDVSEEARKHGVLEQCVIHLMPSYVRQDEAVRVFVIYSGLVGAWKAVKAFDGRFFGGRTVKAKFYDEKAFATRTLHL